MLEAGGDWAVIVHGGAKEIPPDRREAHRLGCVAAANAGAAILRAGGSALDAVEASVRVLEDDRTFNAGFGSVLNADGAVEMDAAIMDGATLDIGGVGAISGVRHPISVARAMLRARPTLLVAEGARRFAEAHGAELCAPDEMIAPEQRGILADEHDTVGCVAVDALGDIVAGTSTGGLTGKAPGRIGDSPLPGCGLYARNGTGGVAFSGEGEAISRLTLAAEVMRQLSPQETAVSASSAAQRALAGLPRLGADGGAIVIDGKGRVGWAHNSPQFAVAYATSATPAARAFIERDEDDHV